MDPKIVIGFIFSHYVVIFGTTLALFFTVSMILLIRSIGQNQEETLAIDVTAIEGAMKRVLATQPVAIAAGTKIVAPTAASASASEDGSAGPSGPGSAEMEQAIAERDAKIEALNREMDELKASMSQSAEAADTSAFTSEIAGLNGKVEELQARLAEYEIIEDDIADLSMFKDENRKLKEELESLKGKLAETEKKLAVAPPPPPTPQEAAADLAMSLTPALDAGIKFEKKDRFELDLNDDVIKMFAAANGAPIDPSAPVQAPVTPESLGSQSEIDALMKAHVAEAAAPAVEPEPAAPAVDPQAEIDALMKAHAAEAAPVATAVVHAAPSAFDDLFGADSAVSMPEEPKAPTAAAQAVEDEDPLAGTPDPDKMLSEVETLSADDGEAADALEETLDTDRLLAEVDSLSKGKAS